MTDEEILRKVIEKAEKNGWKMYYSLRQEYIKTLDDYYNEGFGLAGTAFLNGIFFDHDFAKAFFGEERVTEIQGNTAAELVDYHWELKEKTEEIIKNGKVNGKISGKDQMFLDKYIFFDGSKKELIKYFKRTFKNHQKSWQYHLPKLAFSENKLQYLKQFLDKVK